MREFARLCVDLGELASTAARVGRLAAYLRNSDDATAACATSLLLGHRPRRAVTSGELRAWAAERTGLPEWLVAACRDAVGDSAETYACLLPEPAADAPAPPLAAFHRRFVAELPLVAAPERRRRVEEAWASLDADGRFVYHKLLGGGFRIGVSRGLVLRAVAEARGIPLATATDRLHAAWRPDAAAWRALADDRDGGPGTQPFPFCLARDLAGDPETLGAIGDWQVEWKYDGLRGQLLRRGGAVALWSRGEERLDASFPELLALGRRLPDGTVLDGEILLAVPDLGRPYAPFAELQRRLGRKRIEPGLFDRLAPRFVAYDLLAADGADLRPLPTGERRARLAALVAATADEALALSPTLDPPDWPAAAALRETSRARGVEGLMLKRRDAPYAAGRTGGAWLKWKVDPFAIDLAIVAARAGSGRRAGLLTDYTLAARADDGTLVTVAQAYSGLDDREIRALDRILRDTTRGRRGPMRLVEPTVVLEIGFEGIAESARHRAGVALRFPRILRWRRDKGPAEADTLAALRAFLA